jgi:hypothetical protein
MKLRCKSFLFPPTIALLAACRASAPVADPHAATPPAVASPVAKPSDVAPPDGESSADHAELARLCEEDQADRKPHAGPPIDGKQIVARDKAREDRVKELYRAGELRTARDYHHAALILQHAHEPDDYLLAHELCVIALAKGDHDAVWLCAATEDRFLMNINRPQRFATQYKAEPGGPMRLYPVGDGVTDALRAEFHVPPLEKAKEREAQFAAPPAKSP